MDLNLFEMTSVKALKNNLPQVFVMLIFVVFSLIYDFFQIIKMLLIVMQ